MASHLNIESTDGGDMIIDFFKSAQNPNRQNGKNQ
jgi:hypothetical protein